MSHSTRLPSTDRTVVELHLVPGALSAIAGSAEIAMDGTCAVQAALQRVVPKVLPGATVGKLDRLSGGATQEIWSFDLQGPLETRSLILRRAPAGVRTAYRGAGLELEAAVMRRALGGGVPVPVVEYVLEPEDGLGSGFLMSRMHGETLGHRIVRDAEFALARERFALQAGIILTRIHALDTSDLRLRSAPAAAEIEHLDAQYRRLDWPRPVFDLALHWLRGRVPAAARTCLVHGDFRNGNLMFGPEGIRGVLDWELVHLGDPLEDLGWLCMNSWRFGEIDRPVGGLAQREALFDAYEAAGGGRVDARVVHFWEVLSTLRWGLICASMLEWIRRGEDASIERHTIARRASETEIDLLRLLDGS